MYAVRLPYGIEWGDVNGTDTSRPRLDTRAARLRLKERREPYWRSISGGMAVGYRRGAKAAPGSRAFIAPNTDGNFTRSALPTT